MKKSFRLNKSSGFSILGEINLGFSKKTKDLSVENMYKNFHPSDHPDFQDLYPERKGEKREFSDHFMDFVSRKTKTFNCQSEVTGCLESIPLLKILWNAIEAQGCTLDLNRNISCEMCPPGDGIESLGTFDKKTNQVVICANNARGYNCCGALYWNMMEMFDKCYYKTDYKNVDHLACTEIRKANLAPISFYNAGKQVYSANFEINQMHKVHVKEVAIESLVKTKFVSEDVAKEAVTKVFDKCYNDLEPIGRRAIDGKDMLRAFHESYIYGY